MDYSKIFLMHLVVLVAAGSMTASGQIATDPVGYSTSFPPSISTTENGLDGFFGGWLSWTPGNSNEPPWSNGSVVIVEFNPVYWQRTNNVDTTVEFNKDVSGGCGSNWAAIQGTAYNSFHFCGAAKEACIDASHNDNPRADDEKQGQQLQQYEALPAGLPQTPPRLAKIVRGNMIVEVAAGGWGEDAVSQAVGSMIYHSNILNQDQIAKDGAHMETDAGGSSFGVSLFGLSITIPSWTSTNGWEHEHDDTGEFVAQQKTIYFDFWVKAAGRCKVHADDDLWWLGAPAAASTGYGLASIHMLLGE